MNLSFEAIYINVKDKEHEFLLEFMFQLTILGRLIHLELDGENRLNASKQLNELNHRILNRLRDLGKEDPWCNKEYLLKMVPHHIGLAPQIKSGVINAASKALAKLNTE